MAAWSLDYENPKLPSRLRKGDVVYTLQRTTGAYRFILNYEGYEDPSEDCPTIAIQSYGNTEEEAVEMMLSILRELGVVK